MTARRAGAAVSDLEELPLRRCSHQPLLGRIWALRSAVTPYDAACVALAEVFDLVLVIADARLARAPGVTCDIDVLSGG
jgi:predicted nucleic acid-binding protein